MPGVGWMLSHFVVGLLGAGLARRYALRRALLDQPGERRSHVAPTPRGGGIAIAASLIGAATWLAWWSPGDAPLLAGFGIGLALVALVGWVDDHRPLAASLRLVVHAVAAAVFACGAWWHAGDPRVAFAAFVAPLVLVNAWNFMDGIDGIAALQAIVVVLVPGLLAGGIGGALAFALVAAAAGFLPWNFPRARLFLGDVGSGAIGFAIGALVALAMAGGHGHALLLALLPLSAFLVDTGFTLCARLLRRERWWEPHVTHAYQAAARRHGHVPVTIAFTGWAVACGVAAWSLRDAAFTSLIISLAAVYAAGAAAWWWLRRQDIAPRQHRGPAMEGRE